MADWIIGNIANIVICAILAVIVAGIIVKLIRDRKRGVSSCGCNCAHCSLSGTCHAK